MASGIGPTWARGLKATAAWRGWLGIGEGAFWKTLRFRLALWVTGLLVASLVVFGAFVYWRVARGLWAAVDDSLRLGASQALAAVKYEDGRLDLDDVLPGSTVTALFRQRDLTLRVLDADGALIQAAGEHTSPDITDVSLAQVREGRAKFETIWPGGDNESLRVISVPIAHQGRLVGILQVSQSLEDIERTLRRLWQALLLGGSVLVLVAGAGGYVLTTRALAPIDQITRTARRIAARTDDLSARLNLPPTEDEVGRLASTFDEMLARLEDSFRRERQFTADASHELRTPLAAMQAILGVVRAEPRSAQDYAQALADLAEETDRLNNMIASLLVLARGDARPSLAYAAVDLATLVEDVTDSMRAQAEAKGLELTCATPAGLTLPGDSDQLIRLVVNLLDNAIKFTESGGITVRAGTAAGGGAVDLVIADTGIGIPAEQLDRIFDRFYRVDAARTARGSGLGLAIAQDIARAHGGTIAVESREGRGTTFRVRLPAHDDAPKRPGLPDAWERQR